MSQSHPHRDFITISDFTRDELIGLFALADRMHRGVHVGKPLKGKTIAMLFLKSSTRTRVSFEVGTYQLGGHALFLSDRDVQLGRGEPISDTARVLSRMVDGIMIRTYAHGDNIPFRIDATRPAVPFEVLLNFNPFEGFLLGVRRLRDSLKPFSLIEYMEQQGQHVD